MGFLIPGSLVRVQPGVLSWGSSGGARPEGIATPKRQPAGSSPAGRTELGIQWRSEARRDRDA